MIRNKRMKTQSGEEGGVFHEDIQRKLLREIYLNEGSVRHVKRMSMFPFGNTICCEAVDFNE